MPRILRTTRFESDVLAIWLYIAEDNMAAADRLVDRFETTFQTLAESPGIGMPQNQYRPGLRSYPLGNYFIFYFPNVEGITVYRVLHAARFLDVLL